MSRFQKMLSMETHAVNGKLFKKLTKAERSIVENFVLDNEYLSRDEYAHKVNRWYLDQPKPKHYSDMWAIVLQCI